LPADANKSPEMHSAYSGFSGLDRRSDQGVRDQYGHIISGNRGIIEQWDEENDDQELYNMLNKNRGRKNDQLPNQPSSNNLLSINYNMPNRDGRQSRSKARPNPIAEIDDTLQSQQT